MLHLVKLEIVRRRVDEIGTNEPNILKEENDRILVEFWSG